MASSPGISGLVCQTPGWVLTVTADTLHLWLQDFSISPICLQLPQYWSSNKSQHGEAERCRMKLLASLSYFLSVFQLVPGLLLHFSGLAQRMRSSFDRWGDWDTSDLDEDRFWRVYSGWGEGERTAKALLHKCLKECSHISIDIFMLPYVYTSCLP